MTNSKLLGLFLAGLALVGCETEADLLVDDEQGVEVDKGGYVGPDPSVGDPEPDDVETRLELKRFDYASTIVPYAGNWGGWSSWKYCPEGTYASGFAERIEGNLSNGDDTGLNAVRLTCKNLSLQNVSKITPHTGWWGSWQETNECSLGGFFTGGQVRYEVPQGSGDDTAANRVGFSCSDTSTPLRSSVSGGWGKWEDMEHCPVGSLVCGAQIRIEGKQGDGDDTAMNGIKLACCWK